MFLAYYVRARVYVGDKVYENVLIGRFLCNRFNSVPAGTHRTFSLLPYPLVPYSPYSLDVTFAMAGTLAEHAENAYQTSHSLASEQEKLTPVVSTLIELKHRLHQAADKWGMFSHEYMRLSGIVEFVEAYSSELLPSVSGICALSYDYFYGMQKHLPYMKRDFLFGTPSQKRFQQSRTPN